MAFEIEHLKYHEEHTKTEIYAIAEFSPQGLITWLDEEVENQITAENPVVQHQHRSCHPGQLLVCVLMDEIGLNYSSEVVQEGYQQADNLIKLQRNYFPVNLLSEKAKEHNQQCRA